MPLEVTAGPLPVAAGVGPPGLAAGPPTPPGGAGPPFAALLAQQKPPIPTATLKATPGAGTTPETTKDTNKSQDDDAADATDPRSAVETSAPDAALTMDWAALAAMQPLRQAPVQATTPTTDLPVSGAATTQIEVMDTAPNAVSDARPAQTQATGRELLPAQTDTPVTAIAPSIGLAATGVPTSPVVAASDTPATVSSDALARPAPSAGSADAGRSSLAVSPLPSTTHAPEQAPTAPTPTTQKPQASAPPPKTVAPVPLTQTVPSPTVEALSSAAFDVVTEALPQTIPAFKRPSQTTPWPTATAAQMATPDSLVTPPVSVGVSVPAAPAAGGAATPAATADLAPPPDEKAPRVALQNDLTPANNTGRTTSSGAKTAPTLHTTAPAGEAGDGRPATETASKTAALPTGSAAQSPTISPSSRRKEAEGTEEADPSPSSTPETADAQGAEAATLTALPTDIPSTPDMSSGVMSRPLTGAERDQVVRQMADGVTAVKPHVVAQGHGQMTLDLHPKEWGDLRVTIKLVPGQTEDGLKQTVVTAHVVASSPAVKVALETHTAELNRALHETGLRLERLTVTVQAAGAGDPSDGGQGSGRQSSDRWQPNPLQTDSGNAGLGAGGSSSFAAFSERQGGGMFQNQTAARPSYRNAEGGDTGRVSAPIPASGTRAGFDQRA